MKVLARLYSFLETLGEILFHCLFQLFEAATFLGLWPSSPIFRARNVESLFNLSLIITSFPLMKAWKKFSAFKIHVLIESTWITQDSLPISRSIPLITSALSLLQYKVTYWQVLGIRVWKILGTIILYTIATNTFHFFFPGTSHIKQKTKNKNTRSYFLELLLLEDEW